MKILKTLLFILIFFPFSLVVILGIGYYKLHHKHKTPVILIQCWDGGVSDRERKNSDPSYTQAWVLEKDITTFVDAGIGWTHDGKQYYIKGDCQARRATTEDDSILSPEHYLGAQSIE